MEIYTKVRELQIFVTERGRKMKVKIAQIQAHVYEEKSKNLEELERNLKRIKDENIDLVTLGEMFNCPYQTPCFPVYAEMEQGETWQRLSALAKKIQDLSVSRKCTGKR